ncbi:hypothetical protein H9Q08_03625 [Chryseobacterium sp. PS-8]|uniref:Uncharacterized protein n=1 Tax=Chryseobacterium indicum TaxID=2766954 RepID=A0ABS9C242_9FLAO|nr:hypothetical protein [Chryseobacterium sp. PS-8]MCF2218385.1 hypothetical protein [Chryseobacterium sp. PS-8]
MKYKIIEEFKGSVSLDSIRTQFIQIELDEDLFNYVTFRILKNSQEFEYSFNYVLEYNQQETSISDGFYMNTTNDWYNEYKKNNTEGRQITTIPDGTRTRHQLDAKHFVFVIDGYCFNILAEKYIISENRFFETYREDSEKIKKIVS